MSISFPRFVDVDQEEAGWRDREQLKLQVHMWLVEFTSPPSGGPASHASIGELGV